MKPPRLDPKAATTLFLMLLSTVVFATSNYEYRSKEYVTINNGISPNRALAVTAHGDGELGYDHFHLYLFDAIAGKKIGPLEEIVGTLIGGGSIPVSS